MTDYYIANRAGGKSTNLLLWAATHPGAVIITHSEQASKNLLGLSIDLGLQYVIKPEQFVSYPSLRAGGSTRGLERHPIAVDNLDIILFGQDFVFDYATLTGHPARRWRLEES